MSYRISPNSRYKQQSPNSVIAASNHLDSAPNSNGNSPNQTRPNRGSPKSVQIRNDQVKQERADPAAPEASTRELTDNNHDEARPSNGQMGSNTEATNPDCSQPSTPTHQQNGQDHKPSKDSPAFRLRTRRSTPRKLDSIYSSPYSTSRKTSLYSPTNSEQLQAKVAKLKSAPTASATLNDVKRNLFDSNRTPKDTKKSRSRSPSSSLVEDVDLNVFAENIRVEKLTEAGKNSLNYLCLRIIEVLNEESLTECSPECGSNRIVSPSKCSSTNNSTNNSMVSSADSSNENHKLTDSSRLNDHHLSPAHNSSPNTTITPTADCPTCPKQRLLKLYCQQAETKSVLNAQKPVVLLQLLNEYCNFKDRLLAGKILEIVKFEVKQLPQPANYRHSTGEVPVYPFFIEVRANKDHHWVSYLSIKKKYVPTNSNLLNVINAQNKHPVHAIEDQPPTKNPRVVFSSYVVNEPATEQTNQPLKNTNSPTIRRFMKKINKSVK